MTKQYEHWYSYDSWSQIEYYYDMSLCEAAQNNLSLHQLDSELTLLEFCCWRCTCLAEECST